MLTGLKEDCHLPINFLFRVHHLATNGNPLMQFTHFLIAFLWSIRVYLLWFFFFSFFFFVAEDNFKLLERKEDVQVTEYHLPSFVCVCMCAEPRRWSQRGQREGVMLLKSTTPICLSVRCLAWLSSTQWWCWQNDRRGAHSSECQFGCKAPLPQERWSSHTPKQKRERAL